MKFTKLYEEMELKLRNHPQGFQTSVKLDTPIEVKDGFLLREKTKELNEQIKERILLTCLLRTAGNKENTLNILNDIVGNIVKENTESLNDHHAAKPIFDRLSEIIKRISSNMIHS